MKKLLTLSALMLLFVGILKSQSVTLIESVGWLESAYIQWLPVEAADSYNVYYSGEGVTNRKIDTQLIRSYGTYFRADIIGLKAGSYTFKIAPVVAGAETTGVETNAVAVLAHDRTGFCFESERVPGAYKADGTMKDGAVVVYVTEKSKNTVSLTVTGATTNPCVGLQTILDGFKKGKDNRPLIVRFVGEITDFSYMQDGDIVVENNNNAAGYITLEGIGSDAVANGWGVRLKGATNIEVRNLGTMNCNSTAGDNFGLQQDNDHVWLHHCDMFYGNAGSDADQIKGDGALDNKGSTYITFSYNHFWDSGKASLLGLSEGTTSGLYITYHHNWFDHSDSRHPRVHYYSAHVYNNYYDGIAKYGVGSTKGSSVFVENNYFRNCKYPMLTSMQGTDIFYAAEGTFSGEDGGTIKAYNNTMSGQTRFVPYNEITYPKEFDAIEAASRDQRISPLITSKAGGNTYNNFDTDPALYVQTLIPDNPEVAKTKTTSYAGRVSGGDLKWVFDNSVDDASSDVNLALKAAITNYKTALVSVQGEGTISGSTQTLSSTANKNQTVESGIAISAIVFTWGGDATDAVVAGLPASGIAFVKDVSAKIITISGVPTATITYTVSTTGTAGTPASVSGTITVSNGGGTNASAMVHNFTSAGIASSFYTISGNLSTSKGTVNYADLTLTQCLKMETSTSITFTTSQEATLILVFNPDFVGGVKIDGVIFNPTAGVLTKTIAAGTHTIAKGDASNLYFMSVAYATTKLTNRSENSTVVLFPNPVKDVLAIKNSELVLSVSIYSLAGVLTQYYTGNIHSANMSSLPSGTYFVKVETKQGVITERIIKE